jgi:hypothetical protein
MKSSLFHVQPNETPMDKAPEAELLHVKKLKKKKNWGEIWSEIIMS